MAKLRFPPDLRELWRLFDSMVHHLDKSLRCGACAFILALSVTPSAIAKSRLPEYLRKPDTWFAGAEAKTIAANILTYQADLGGWPKNTDTTSAPYTGNRKQLKGTFDNDATTDELRFLARIFTVTKEDRYRPAIDKGIDHILQAAISNGRLAAALSAGQKLPSAHHFQ